MSNGVTQFIKTSYGWKFSQDTFRRIRGLLV
jgi:hypothetical protein